MSDEAFHHKFGKIWADKTVPKLTEEEHEKRRGLGRRVLPPPAQQPGELPSRSSIIYKEFGLDWQWVRSAVMESLQRRRPPRSP